MAETESLYARFLRERGLLERAMVPIDDGPLWCAWVFQTTDQKLTFLRALRWDEERFGTQFLCAHDLAAAMRLPKLPEPRWAPIEGMRIVGRVGAGASALRAPGKVGRQADRQEEQKRQKKELTEIEQSLRQAGRTYSQLVETDFYFLVCFGAAGQRARFLAALREPDAQYVNGARIARLLQIGLPPGPKWKPAPPVKPALAELARRPG